MNPDSPRLAFRPLEAGDVDVLAGWLRDADLGRGLESASARARAISDPRIVCQVAIDEHGRRVGIYRLDLAPDQTAELTLVVAPDARRRGVGSRLLAAALETARRLGLRSLVALVTTGGAGAKAFFLASGFESLGEASPGFVRLSRIVHSGESLPPLEITP